MRGQYTKKGPGREHAQGGNASKRPQRHDFDLKWDGGKIVHRKPCKKCGAKYVPGLRGKKCG